MKFTVSRSQKLSRALDDRSVGYAAFRKLLRKREIRVNGRRVSEDETLSPGDQVEVYVRLSVPVVYEDDRILVCDKPANMETVGEGALEEILRETRPTVIACHRLDRNTEGLVIFAKSERAEHEIARLLRERRILKIYECLVLCRGTLPEGRFEAYLCKDARLGKVNIFKDSQKDGKKILTNVRELDKINKEISRAEVWLETGRTHQIRAHLAYLGCPVLGDGKYGDFEANRRYGKKGQMLRATRLEFRNCDGMFADLNGTVLRSQRTWNPEGLAQVR